jgi:hypothetical protein
MLEERGLMKKIPHTIYYHKKAQIKFFDQKNSVRKENIMNCHY